MAQRYAHMSAKFRERKLALLTEQVGAVFRAAIE